jgi:hypothetical protein
MLSPQFDSQQSEKDHPNDFDSELAAFELPKIAIAKLTWLVQLPNH